VTQGNYKTVSFAVKEKFHDDQDISSLTSRLTLLLMYDFDAYKMPSIINQMLDVFMTGNELCSEKCEEEERQCGILNDCSGFGKCIGGTCSCDPGHVTVDCSQSNSE
jgi:hypothetical protein